jgi:flavin-dependent dehydrogenase
MNSKASNQYDAVVVGGGPAGASAAAVLARHGRSVAVLEKEPFPRYHVGESLLPFCYFSLERIGMIDKLNQSDFIKKYSVQFATADGRISAPFYFKKHLDDHPASQTWQVERSDFDRMMLDNARERGADVFLEHTVKSFIKNGETFCGVVANNTDGEAIELEAKVTIDGTGRDAFAVTKNGWRVRDPKLNKVAIWTYYEGAIRDEGIDEGATTVCYLPNQAWFWFIPLRNNRVSIGLVADREYIYRDGRDPGEIISREIQNNKWMADHLAPAKQVGEYWVTGDFSYRSKYCAADGLVLTGDAFAFLDPVFSSGVFLALLGGVACGDAVHQALENSDVSAQAFDEYGESVILNLEAMRKIVYAFYDPNFSFKSMLMKYPETRPALTDCLIGNTARNFDELFKAMNEFAELPEPLPHGRIKAAV